eukprot:10242897-Alexandrium_andersonii.AAC.1
MSASLVGSEMCIRDRSVTAKSLVRGLQICNPLAIGAWGPKHWVWVGRAVSYTHLTLPTICSV